MKRSHKGKKVTPSNKAIYRKRPPKPEPDDIPGKEKRAKRLKGVMI